MQINSKIPLDVEHGFLNFPETCKLRTNRNNQFMENCPYHAQALEGGEDAHGMITATHLKCYKCNMCKYISAILIVLTVYRCSIGDGR